MEAVWNIEDKWKLSTKEALFLLLFAASAIAGLCMVTTTVMLLRRLKSHKTVSPQQQKQQLIIMDDEDWTPDAACGWAAIKTALMGSLRWSRASKWGEVGGSSSSGGSSSWQETPPPLLEKRPRSRVGEFRDHDEAGMWLAQSQNSESPVWQRPILMGEKCELPRFSGLILYDERGQLLCDVARGENSSCTIVTSSEEKTTAKVVRTTLRDLLY